MTLQRLVLVGSVVVDNVLFVPHLPELGGDVIAEDSLTSAAGGYNVLAAAARQGLPGILLGRHGVGPNGDVIRSAFATDGIRLHLPASPEGDSGFCIGLVDSTGERSYVTMPGVDGHLDAQELFSIPLTSSDAVYLSGYELNFAHAEAVTSWFSKLDSGIVTVFDPGPLVAELPANLLEAVLHRTNWMSLNQREALLLTATEGPEATQNLLDRYPQLTGVVLRAGGSGCWVAERKKQGETAVHIPVPIREVTAIDTTGAGDCHVGVFISTLGRGATAIDAARWANTAAALSVQKRGPATSPTRQETASHVR